MLQFGNFNRHIIGYSQNRLPISQRLDRYEAIIIIMENNL